jgi:hypothetical protein
MPVFPGSPQRHLDAIEAQMAHLRLSDSVSPMPQHLTSVAAGHVGRSGSVRGSCRSWRNWPNAPGYAADDLQHAGAHTGYCQPCGELRDGDADSYEISKERLDSLRRPLGDMAQASTLGEAGGL